MQEGRRRPWANLDQNHGKKGWRKVEGEAQIAEDEKALQLKESKPGKVLQGKGDRGRGRRKITLSSRS